MSPKQLAALVLAATALTAAGCGSSSKSQSSTTATNTTAASTAAATTTAPSPTTTTTSVTIASGKPLSHAVWIAKGDAICAQMIARLGTLQIKTREDYARVLPQGAAFERAAVASMSKLVPPASKTNDWRNIVTAVQFFAENTIRTIPYFISNDAAAGHPLLVAGYKDRLKMDTIAKRDGLKDCAKF